MKLLPRNVNWLVQFSTKIGDKEKLWEGHNPEVLFSTLELFPLLHNHFSQRKKKPGLYNIKW